MRSGIQPLSVVLPFSACVFLLMIQDSCLFSSHHIYMQANMEREQKKDILFPLEDTSQVHNTWFWISHLNLDLAAFPIGKWAWKTQSVSQVTSTLKGHFIEEEVVVAIYGQQHLCYPLAPHTQCLTNSSSPCAQPPFSLSHHRFLSLKSEMLRVCVHSQSCPTLQPHGL